MISNGSFWSGVEVTGLAPGARTFRFVVRSFSRVVKTECVSERNPQGIARATDELP